MFVHVCVVQGLVLSVETVCVGWGFWARLKEEADRQALEEARRQEEEDAAALLERLQGQVRHHAMGCWRVAL